MTEQLALFGVLGDNSARDAISTELDATLFVEAGAGTGKTRALVDRVVALVTSDGPDLPVPMRAIAAITFTEKAAAEHGSKVSDAERAAIENAIAALKASIKDEDVEDIVSPVASIAAPPKGCSSTSTAKPKRDEAASKPRSAAVVTSGPMPSPGRTQILIPVPPARCGQSAKPTTPRLPGEPWQPIILWVAGSAYMRRSIPGCASGRCGRWARSL